MFEDSSGKKDDSWDTDGELSTGAHFQDVLYFCP